MNAFAGFLKSVATALSHLRSYQLTLPSNLRGKQNVTARCDSCDGTFVAHEHLAHYRNSAAHLKVVTMKFERICFPKFLRISSFWHLLKFLKKGGKKIVRSQ